MPELIELEAIWTPGSITRAQLIDLAILVGTDFNDGVKGIGPKKALKLVQEHGWIEEMPAEVRDAVGDPSTRSANLSAPGRDRRLYDEVREPDRRGSQFPVRRAEFSRERVTAALERAFPPDRLF